MLLPNATVSVKRYGSTISAGAETHDGYSLVAGLSAVPVLIETMSAKQQMTILGTLSQRVYRMTWGTEAILDDDRITWGSRVFTLQYDADDQYRVGTNLQAYQTGILTEVAATPV